MPSCFRRGAHHLPTCACLVEAYRAFPAHTNPAEGCTVPDCPIRSLDGITLHQFLEALGGPDSADNDTGPAEDRAKLHVFRPLARPRNRGHSRRLPE